MKKEYEESSNSLMFKEDCLLLPDADSEFGKRFVYQRIVLRCKAGPERKCQSKGLRKSSTIKKNCPVKVSAEGINCNFIRVAAKQKFKVAQFVNVKFADLLNSTA